MDIKTQITINSIGNVVLMLAQWLISVLLVRMGGFADAGVFSLAMTIANVFGAIANCGVRNYQVSDAGNQFMQKEYLWTRICTAAVSFVICCVYLAFDSTYTVFHKLAILLYLLYINLNMLSDVMYGSLQMKGRLYLNGYSSIIKGCACLTVFLLSYLLKHSLLLSLLLMALADAGVVAFYDFKHYVAEEKQGICFSGAVFRPVVQVIKAGAPLMVSSLISYTITAVPRRAIQRLLGEKYLGYYSSLFTPSVIITTLMPAIVLGIMPSIAKYWSTGEKKLFARQVAGCFAGITGFTLLALFCALLAGKPVIRIAFGSEILPYFDLLYIAIIVSGLSALKSCGDSVLVCMRKTKAVTAAAAADLIAVALLTNTLVLRGDIKGAAWVLLVGHGFHLVIDLGIILWFCKKHFS